MFWYKTRSLSPDLSFVWAAVILDQAGIGPNTITEFLNKDDRLAVYGPYRLLTEQERRWLLQAQKGGTQSKSLFHSRRVWGDFPFTGGEAFLYNLFGA